MKMKRIINTLLCTAALLLAASCLQEEMVVETPVNESIILDLSSGLTKAEQTATESYVNNLDVFIFDVSAGRPDNLIVHETFAVNNASKVTLDAKRSSFGENQEYFVYLLANSTIDLSGIGSFDDLNDLKQEDALLHLTGLDVPDAPRYFLMDAVAEDAGGNSPVVLYNGVLEEDTELHALLARAAAKVVVNITASDNVTFRNYGIEDGSEGGLFYVRNLPYDTWVLAETQAATDLQGVLLRTTAKTDTEYFTWNPEYAAGEKNVTLTTYVYPHHWDNESILDKETCAVINLPLDFKVSDTETVSYPNSWYKIPMTDNSTFERNNLYQINITLDRPGASDESEPIELDEISYTVEDWTGVTVSVGNDDRPKYLSVNETSMTMHNVAKDTTTLEFASSSPVTIDVEDVYYYNKFGQVVSVSPEDIYGTTIDGSIAGNITVYSPVPENNAILYFTLVISNEDGLERTVEVTQYPLEYITGVVGSYSYRDDFFYPDGNSNDEDNLSVPTTWNTAGDMITTATWNNGSWRYRKNTTGGAFTSKVAYQMYSSGLANIDYYYYDDRWGNISKSRSNALDPGNPRMYHVRIMATSPTYTLGIPILDADGYTDSSAENAKLVSPSFMLASQLGAVSSGQFDNYDMVASHCKEYVEVYIDPDTNQEVHLRDWRLPTRAEVEIIYKYQNDSEVMDEVLAGTNYWCADKGTVRNPEPTLSGTFLRCIRDVY